MALLNCSEVECFVGGQFVALGDLFQQFDQEIQIILFTDTLDCRSSHCHTIQLLQYSVVVSVMTMLTVRPFSDGHLDRQQRFIFSDFFGTSTPIVMHVLFLSSHPEVWNCSKPHVSQRYANIYIVYNLCYGHCTCFLPCHVLHSIMLKVCSVSLPLCLFVSLCWRRVIPVVGHVCGLQVRASDTFLDLLGRATATTGYHA